jgi:uncharacterized protein YcbK (DUF882 family)
LVDVLSLAVALMALRLGGAALAASDVQDRGEGGEPELSGQAAEGRGGAGKEGKSRRKPAGYSVPDEKLRWHLPPAPSGNLHLFHAFRGESLKINIYNPDGSYNVDALNAVSHLLRCTRTDTERDIEPRLLAVLSHVYDHFGERRIEVTSGYRNQRHTTSNHYRGSATDIFIPGVKPTKLRAFVETLDAGGMGIGIYPRSGFLHVDVRPPPSYRWTDLAPVDPDDPKRRPPRSFKKKKPPNS